MLSFQYLFCEGTQVGIPFLAESARQRLLQKLIHPDILSPALPHGIAAHVPAMIVKPDETIGKLLFAYRIERATDRLAEARLALSVCPFESAETALAVVAGEDTVLAVDYARNHVAVAVAVSHALLVDDSLCLSRKVVPDAVQTVFQFTYLVHQHRRTGIALYAADALALVVVAAEKLRYDVGRQQHIVQLQYR